MKFITSIAPIVLVLALPVTFVLYWKDIISDTACTISLITILSLIAGISFLGLIIRRPLEPNSAHLYHRWRLLGHVILLGLALASLLSALNEYRVAFVSGEVEIVNGQHIRILFDQGQLTEQIITPQEAHRINMSQLTIYLILSPLLLAFLYCLPWFAPLCSLEKQANHEYSRSFENPKSRSLQISVILLAISGIIFICFSAIRQIIYSSIVPFSMFEMYSYAISVILMLFGCAYYVRLLIITKSLRTTGA